VCERVFVYVSLCLLLCVCVCVCRVYIYAYCDLTVQSTQRVAVCCIDFYISTLIMHLTSSRFCIHLLIFVTFSTHLHTRIYRYRGTHTSTHVRLAHRRTRRSGENQAQESRWNWQTPEEVGVWLDTKA